MFDGLAAIVQQLFGARSSAADADQAARSEALQAEVTARVPASVPFIAGVGSGRRRGSDGEISTSVDGGPVQTTPSRRSLGPWR